MKIVDLNILLYAVNPDARHYAVARHWWEGALNGQETIGLAWVVLLGFVRVSTNPRATTTPITVEQATSKIDTWLAHPLTMIVREENNHWPLVRGLLEQVGAGGNLTTDAHLAALALDRDATVASCDTDFSRFPNLKWENPLAPMP